MSTSGAYGFYRNGISKITYNHSDSHPESLGQNIVEFLRNSSVLELNETFNYIELVDKKSKPAAEQIEECKEFYCKNEFDMIDSKSKESMLLGISKYFRISVDELNAKVWQNIEDNDINDWYWLLQKTQGTLECYKNKSCRYMINNSRFIGNGLACEWAYVINLDTNELEIYKGLQNYFQRNRYSRKEEFYLGKQYKNCHLIKTFKLNNIPHNWKEYLGN